MTRPLHYGIYEALLDRNLKEALERHPELRSVLGKIDFEEQPARYAAFLAAVIEQALRHETDSASRLAFCNRLIEQIPVLPDRAHIGGRFLVEAAEQLLLEITPPNYAVQGLPRPDSPLTEASLFTGSPSEPQLAHELQAEMHSADSVDILVSFIKWSGLRLLMKAFEDLRTREIPVRVITTAYMGASDAAAVEWLAKQPNVQVRVSYDTERTRLHAKAYHFKRLSGFSTAYIGSANMSHAAITSGLEWNLKVTSQDMAHILEKFAAEFETYWNSREFIPFDSGNPQRFRDAIHRARNVGTALDLVGDGAMLAHYRIWGNPCLKLGIPSLEDSFRRISENPSVLSDLMEILEWAESETTVEGQVPELPFPSLFELHAQYGSRDVQAVLGQATLETAGQTGVGLLHFPSVRAYALLITYQKTEREFSPSTMYADYPISRELLHWESQSNTAQQSETGQNLIHHADRGYTILIFARDKKKTNGSATPFVYLGPADRVSYESERPIKMVWKLRYPIPVEMYEKNRRGG